VEENSSSTRQLASQFQVSQFVVCRTLKEQGLHPYHVQRLQTLQPNDYIRRQEFCEWVLQKCVDQPDFLRIVLFTDEEGFTRNEVFNSHNTHIQPQKSGTIQQVLQGFGTIYIEEHRRVLKITADILNNSSNCT
jgi:hypothetical protein